MHLGNLGKKVEGSGMKPLLGKDNYTYFLKNWGDVINVKKSLMATFISIENKECKNWLYKTDLYPTEETTKAIADDLIQMAKKYHSKQILIAQNKISDNLSPTKRELTEASILIGILQNNSIKVSDYIFMSNEGYCSFDENNFLNSKVLSDLIIPQKKIQSLNKTKYELTW